MFQEFLESMAILPAIIGAAGTLIGGALSSKGAKDTNEQSIDFQKKRHQYEVEDLKKAGLNPILSAGQSSAPNVPQLKNPGEAWGEATKNTMANASSALDLDIKEQQVKNLELQAQQTAAVTQGINYQNDVLHHQKGVEEKKWRILDGLADDAMKVYDFTVGNVKEGLGSAGEVSKEMYKRFVGYNDDLMNSAKQAAQGLSPKGDKGKSKLTSKQRMEIMEHPPNREPVYGDPLYDYKMMKHKDWKENPDAYR